MKKILSLIAAMSITSLSYAENLECEKSYSELTQIFDKSYKISKSDDAVALMEFNQQYDYTFLFNGAHSDKFFYDGEWENKEKYIMASAIGLEFTKTKKYKQLNTKLNKPKLNYISHEIGEICVIPVERELRIFDKRYTERTDYIFVKNTNEKQWRFYPYLGYESKSDFKKLFPDFSGLDKLSAQTINGKLIDSPELFELNNKIAEAILEEKISEELKNELKNNAVQKGNKLKENGYK